jgi:hypothetical protein
MYVLLIWLFQCPRILTFEELDWLAGATPLWLRLKQSPTALCSLFTHKYEKYRISTIRYRSSTILANIGRTGLVTPSFPPPNKCTSYGFPVNTSRPMAGELYLLHANGYHAAESSVTAHIKYRINTIYY